MHLHLIVGLGNPGSQYANTRHNVGAWFVDALRAKYDGIFKTESKFKGSICSINVADHECKLLIPNTFMNLSGQSVRAVANFYKIPTEAILVAHDELDFLPGTVRFKHGGSAGGHNGVQDIINQLGAQNFYRLRFGIGKPEHREMMADYVLHAPSKTELNLIDEAITKTIALSSEMIFGNFPKVMQELHAPML